LFSAESVCRCGNQNRHDRAACQNGSEDPSDDRRTESDGIKIQV
jgi:hypothetical protein